MELSIERPPFPGLFRSLFHRQLDTRQTAFSNADQRSAIGRKFHRIDFPRLRIKADTFEQERISQTSVEIFAGQAGLHRSGREIDCTYALTGCIPP